jgi:Acetyltransferase (GNAT) domain
MNVHAAWSGATDTASQAPVAIRFVTDRREWDALEARAPFPQLPQSFAYGEAKAASGWTPRRAAFTVAGETIAYATILERRLGGIRVLARVNRGPLFLDAAPSPELIRSVYATLRRRWRGPLLIAPALPRDDAGDAILKGAGFRLRQRRGWQSGRVDLTRTEADIWSGFSSAFRNRYRQSVKAGARLRVAEDAAAYDWMLERHVANMRAKRFKGPSPTPLRALRAAAPENVLVFQLLDGDRAVAGMSVVRFGAYAEYHVGWFGEDGRRLNAGNFLMWEIMKEMKHRGVVSYDLGGMRPGDGYTRFKGTMRPADFTLAGEWMSLV